MLDITNETMREISLPFPNFQPNTLILSEQVNDNNDEIQYRTNLLIKAFNQKVGEIIEFKKLFDGLTDKYNQFVIDTDENFRITDRKIDDNKTKINKRVDTEVATLNKTITDKDTFLKGEVNKLKEGKGDSLEIRNTLLYLKSGDNNISVADLSGLGGGTGRSVNVAFGQLVSTNAWALDEELGLHYINITHRLNTSTPLISFNDGEGFSMFDMFKVVDANTVTVYVDKPLDTYIAVINGSSTVELVQAILDDTQVTELRTWSSKKIQEELDKKSTDAGSTSYDNSTSGLISTTVQGAIDEINSTIGIARRNIIINHNRIVDKLVGGAK